ncbi:MAG: 6-carboxytetrahydropterin synthase [Candidatus Thermoplasmatota archaeon]|nr:6-carboxytetrahydropterin synthase [Candidatus Thermoplasmatota archaeon]MBU1941397.1 6-carboxytetrahydropterin synthase [Candidatus Thermoplasmatota archaeon]
MQLHINGWQQHLSFSAAHLIPHHAQCGILHGHTYVISCTLTGSVQKQTDMLIDFTEIKRHLRSIIDTLDHRVLLPQQHPAVHWQKEIIQITLDKKSYKLPTQDCILLPIPSTTAEHLATYILNEFIMRLSKNHGLETITLTVDEGLGQGATIAHQF